MATPHIAAAAGAIAPAVLMPGDPKRAERMAAAILQGSRVVSDVRGIQVHTGTVEGAPLSIMASGMGMPSMALYATELFRFYGVTRIVRVGTAGGLSPRVDTGDVVVAVGAHTASSMNELRIPGLHFAAVADWGLLAAAMAAAAGDPRVVAGTIVSNDHFYREFQSGYHEALAAHSVLACEMETAALYGVAAAEGRAALAICTVSNHLLKPDRDMTPADREQVFDQALKLAVAAALS
ncbi:MAG: purine-nucleoside phosphorylase [Propionibacteriaceae bacterium]|jgi:purine-nucleoside phosphorylase|nr:purine-nucleoside phosphorylase [Propionibacteriaceae bacterium]